MEKSSSIQTRSATEYQRRPCARAYGSGAGRYRRDGSCAPRASASTASPHAARSRNAEQLSGEPLASPCSQHSGRTRRAIQPLLQRRQLRANRPQPRRAVPQQDPEVSRRQHQPSRSAANAIERNDSHTPVVTLCWRSRWISRRTRRVSAGRLHTRDPFPRRARRRRVHRTNACIQWSARRA